LVTILEEPIIGLDIDVIGPAVAGEPATFVARIQRGSRATFEWIWGDGTTGTGQVVNHTYPRKGPYDVTVRAFNTRNEQIISEPVTVRPRRPQLAPVIDTSPKPPNEDIDFIITAESEEAVTYRWEWGDDTSNETTATRISHRYATAGVYPVRVSARNSGGIAEQLLIAYVGVPRPVQDVEILPEQSILVPGLGAKFVARLKLGNPADYVFEWNFGDNTPITRTTVPVVMHGYAASNLYVVRVQAVRQSAGPDPVKQGDLPTLVGYGLFYPIAAETGSFTQPPPSTLVPTVTITPTTPLIATTPSPTQTSALSATNTPTVSLTSTPNITDATRAPTHTDTPTPRDIVSATPTPIPTLTPTPTPTSTATQTQIITPAPTKTPGDDGTIPPVAT
jgi:PKD repeat protein